MKFSQINWAKFYNFFFSKVILVSHILLVDQEIVIDTSHISDFIRGDDKDTFCHRQHEKFKQ